MDNYGDEFLRGLSHEELRVIRVLLDNPEVGRARLDTYRKALNKKNEHHVQKFMEDLDSLEESEPLSEDDLKAAVNELWQVEEDIKNQQSLRIIGYANPGNCEDLYARRRELKLKIYHSVK